MSVVIEYVLVLYFHSTGRPHRAHKVDAVAQWSHSECMIGIMTRPTRHRSDMPSSVSFVTFIIRPMCATYWCRLSVGSNYLVIILTYWQRVWSANIVILWQSHMQQSGCRAFSDGSLVGSLTWDSLPDSPRYQRGVSTIEWLVPHFPPRTIMVPIIPVSDFQSPRHLTQKVC